MAQLDPTNTTITDICTAALLECGAIGVGQTPLPEDMNDAQARLQWMLMQWERKRWLVYHLIDLALVSTGAQSYTVGPGGQFNTGTGASVSVRPGKLSAAFVRQLQGSMNSVDYPLEILQSREDYNFITLKTLVAGPGEAVFLDSDWPLANLYVWPIPQPYIYEIHIIIHAQLPYDFYNNPTTPFDIPYEYYLAMMYNLAVRLRPKYRMGTYPGDPLPGMAKDSLSVVRAPNTQIMKLRMPNTLRRRGLYNIFSDRPY
jgi:hypothetical protein